MGRIWDRLLYLLERLLLRGATTRLLLMAGVVISVTLLGGALLMAIGQPEAAPDAFWWAFLRLTDSGYMGNDDGVGRRMLSTIVTITGDVLFVGALIAILTQWLATTIARLERGETPIALSDHILVLGMTDRTPVVLDELVRARRRVRSLFADRGAEPQFVCLLQDLSADVRATIADHIDSDDRHRIVMRSGSPLLADHLDRVDFSRASVILIPGRAAAGGRSELPDSVAIKTLLSIVHHPRLREREHPPRLVAELADGRLGEFVDPAYPGVLELLPTNTIIARLVAQNLRHRGLSWVLDELLAFDVGADLLYLPVGDAAGRRFGDAAMALKGGVALGVVSCENGEWKPQLNPAADLVLSAGDQLVVIGQSDDELGLGAPVEPPAAAAPPPPISAGWPKERRVLVLGWSPLIGSLLLELDSYCAEHFTVEVLSREPLEQRHETLDRMEATPQRVTLHQILGDYTNPRDIRALPLTDYDNIVILGRNWRGDAETSDAQTIVCYLMIEGLLGGQDPRPAVLVELTDSDNAALFEDRPGELVLSPLMMSRMLAHVALGPQLYSILEELFTAGGAELHYRHVEEYGFARQVLRFRDVQEAAIARGELAVGMRVSDAELDMRADLVLAPGRDERFDASRGAMILVLTTDPQSVAV